MKELTPSYFSKNENDYTQSKDAYDGTLNSGEKNNAGENKTGSRDSEKDMQNK